jgi:Flp pilus assembly protein TadD
MIEKAVELRPEDGYIVDSLGWAHYRLGDYSSAVEYLEKAIELVPEDPTINDHLGDAYWQSGRPSEARFQWRRALQFGPEADEIKPIEAKLDQGLVSPNRAGGG